MSYYDDNFGWWDGMDPGHPDYDDNMAFRRHVERNSVWKNCHGCGRRVKIMPQYGYCDSCATKREQGWDI